ncbi:SCP2 sterol-binding domain-containing protein [Neobacillus sp. FSL H8-0543]|uniref:SCP2 sterol-binding domain-containing protein n=1 Tax=Neobacillus sp. FSL H8-0543 TaxID=2954672 RepID=UPI0031586247
MNEAIEEFVTSINECNHVLRLFDKVDSLTVKLICNQQSVVIAFQNGKALLLDESLSVDTVCQIFGDLDSLLTLIEGKERLRILVKQGQLKVAGTFRTTLLLESAFYLTQTGKSEDIRIFS